MNIIVSYYYYLFRENYTQSHTGQIFFFLSEKYVVSTQESMYSFMTDIIKFRF